VVQVLEHEHILPLIIKHGARKKARAYVHRVLMVEAVNTTMGGIAQEVHDEVLEYILQVPFLCTPLLINQSIGLYIPLQASLHQWILV
jgi:hypothetical protein